MHTAIITLHHQATSVAFDTAAEMWNLTDLWRAAGSPENRNPHQWIRKDGKRYLEALEKNLTHGQVSENRAHSPIFENVGHTHFEENLSEGQVLQNTGETRIFETRRGRGGGTWGHQLAGLEYARYLSPELSIACNQFLLDYWRGAAGQQQQALHQLEQRVTTLETCERLAALRDLGGSATPKQLFEALQQQGQQVNYLSILQWLHRATRRGLLHRQYQGYYHIDNEANQN